MPFRRSSVTASVAAFVALLVPMVAIGAVGATVTACDNDDHRPSMVEPDEVYVAVIRWQLARQVDEAGTDTSTDSGAEKGDPLPVIYVAAADGSEISAKVQARVAAATIDDATVRFADSGDDVIDLKDDSRPVEDEGVLLSIERIEPDSAQQRTAEVVVYRSIDDQETYVLTVDATGDGATITSSTLTLP